MSGSYLEIAKLLVKNNANVDATDKNGLTPLHYSVKYGLKSFAELLLKNKANQNLKNIEGEKPLDLAREKGVYGLINLLVDK